MAEKLWKTERLDGAIHIHPLDDEKPHDLETTRCECIPNVQWKDSETGEMHPLPIVIHRSYDCRELVDQAEAIKAKTEKQLPK